VEVKAPYKWPLSIDLVVRGFRANADKRLLSLFSRFFDELGPNIEQTLLGGTGFVTMDPENIEALLSTRFEGQCQSRVPKDPCALTYSWILIDRRFWIRASKRGFSVPPWRGYLYTGGHYLEALSRAPAPSIRTDAISKP
jgi:hypothetical protein